MRGPRGLKVPGHVPSRCGHDGSGSGMLSLSRGVLTMQIVCGNCGAVIDQLGKLSYEPHPERVHDPAVVVSTV